MTNEYVDAFNAGVKAVLDIAAASATKVKAAPWKPGREGAAAALDELAQAGQILLRDPGTAGDTPDRDKVA